MKRKILAMTVICSFVSSMILPALAVENEPVTEDVEVLLATFDDEGKLVPVTEAQEIDPADPGHFDLTVPETFPEGKPIFVVSQKTDGTGTPQVSCVNAKGQEDAEVDPSSTAIFNTFASMAKQTGLNPAEADPKQMEEFVSTMKKKLKDVAIAESSAESIDRMAQALSLDPEVFLDAANKFNVPPERLVEVAANIDRAAAPDNFNAFDGLPEEDFSEIPAGSHIPGLLPPEFFAKHMPPEFKDFNEAFCETCPPPGGFQYIGEDGKPAKMPKGTFLMPPLQANAKLSDKFPEDVVFPQGIEAGKGFKMPPLAHIPPGMIFGEGFEPPEGLDIPPGVIKPEDFDEKYADFVSFSDAFLPPEGFQTPPGWGISGDAPMMPPGLAFGDGLQIPEGTFAFPVGDDYIPPKGAPGSKASDFGPPPEGHVFPEGFLPPPGFNPEAHGFVPPSDFVFDGFEPQHHDFTAFKGDEFINSGFDPFFELGGFDPNKTHIPPEELEKLKDAGLIDADFDPENPPEDFKIDDLHGTGPKDQAPEHDCKDVGDCDDGGTNPPPEGDVNNPPPEGDVNNPPPEGDVKNPPPEGDVNNPPPEGDVNNPPPEGDVNNPPPHDDGATHNPAPETFAVNDGKPVNNSRPVLVFADGDNSTIVAGKKTKLAIPVDTKATKATATSGLYRIGKFRSTNSAALLSVIATPTKSSIDVTVAEADNSVNTTTIAVDAEDATEVTTSIEGKTVTMTLVGVDLGVQSVKGYALEVGASGSLNIPKALPFKAKVSRLNNEDDSVGQLVTFKVPKKAKDAAYTMVFYVDGKTYYGNVPVGTLKTRTISGTILAPGGEL